MIYVHDDFDTRYKFLVDYGSNYLVLSKDSYSNGSSGDPDELPCKLIYFSPSFSELDFTYSTTDSTSYSDVSDFFTSNIYYAADFPIILVCSFLLLTSLTFIFNGFTRIVQKGGIVFPK